ncbi:hypothetical protein Tco_1476715 [Tanacetum coccineum]
MLPLYQHLEYTSLLQSALRLGLIAKIAYFKSNRGNHPSLASGTGGKSLASLRRTLPEGFLILGSSSADVHTHVTVQSSRVADAPVYTAADIVTSSRGKTLVVPTSDVGGSSQPETSEESADSFYETAVLNSEDAKRWERMLRLLGLKSLVKEKETESRVVPSLDDSQAACGEPGTYFLPCFYSFIPLFVILKRRWKAQQEEQAQELYNCVAELEAHVMDVSGRLEGILPCLPDCLADEDGLLTHELELAMVTVFVSLRVPRNFGSSFSRAWIWMQEGLAAGHEHGIAGTPLSAVVAYNPETAENNYLDASLPEAAHLQPCLEQLSVPIYHADVNAVAGETSLSFALLNNLLGEASTSVVISCVEDLDTDEDLGSVVCMPQLEDPRFETLP